MLYFSELKGKKVCTEDNVEVGRLQDIIFLIAEVPKLTKLVVKTKNKNKLFIPIEYLKHINNEILLKKDYQVGELIENELYVMRNLLDKQIIDLVGNKIVRVNDVVFQEENGLYLAGVDIGMLAIVRWLGLENLLINFFQILKIHLKSSFLSWADIQPLELSRGFVKLKTKEEKLQHMKPEDLAFYLDKTNIKNVRKILGILDETFAADVISSLNINYQSSLFHHFPVEKAAKIISLVDSDEAVDVLLTLSKTKRQEIIDLLAANKKKEIHYLLMLSKTPIGNVITSQFITVGPDMTAKDVIDIIRKTTQDIGYLYYVYVVNNDKKVIGVFSLHDLLLQDLNTPVYKFMLQNVIVIHLTTPKEIILKKMLKYKVVALPVIDSNHHILGVVSVDDITEFITNKINGND